MGLYDKMKIVRGGMGDAKRALIDGTIDVGWASSVLLTKRADGTWEWVPVPAPGELFQTKKTYVISIPEEVIQKVAKSSGYPLAVGRAAGGHTFGKSTFDEPWTGNLFRSSWYVHKDMPDEIVTEILRVLWENADKFASYHATGKGISKENLVKIFDPFFTTKAFGEGTGLGLSIVHDLINEYNGNIEVKSKPGETIFTVIFPIKENK